jgi:putative ABC transport system permease protein
MSTFVSDVRFAVRTLIRARGFALITVAILAIGIGANTAVFAAVRAIFLRPLPYPDADRIVRLWEAMPGGFRGSVSEQNFLDWQAQTRSLEDMVALKGDSFNLAVERPERIAGLYLTDGAFRLLGARPLLGRAFAPEEFQPGQDRKVVLFHGLWKRAFGGDPGLVGKSIELSGRSYTVVGIMPPGFLFPGMTAEAWFPLPLEKKLPRGSHYLAVLARLRPGVPLEGARADLEAIAGRLAAAYPDTNTNRTVSMLPLREDFSSGLRSTAFLLAMAVGLVLLIGCANVANLLLARASGRRAEIALRVSLGARRGHIVRQLLTESLVLALAGAGLGLLLALWGTDALEAALPGRARALFTIHLDLQVMAFAAGLGVASALIFGLAPALEASRPDLSAILKEGAARATAVRGRWKRALVVAEVGLSVLLVVGAGLLLRSLHRLGEVSLGFPTERLLTLRIALPEASYPDERSNSAFYDRLLAAVAALPGVASAGVVDDLPLASENSNGSFEIVGRPPWPRGQEPITEYLSASPGYFATLGVPLLRGRGFTAADTAASAPVVLVSETFARRFFPGGNAVGQRLKLWGNPCEIVGVLADVRRRGQHREPLPETYLPLPQRPRGTMSLVVRTHGDPQALAGAVRAQVQAVDPKQAVFAVRTMEEMLAESVSLRRFQALLLSLFAGIALLLASLGIYGVMAYHVSQRTQEMGIRMALGAPVERIRAMVVREGMLLCGLGLVLGAAGAVAASRLLGTLVFGVGPLDPPSYLAAAALLLAVGLLASWLPARRATRVDPVNALRAF